MTSQNNERWLSILEYCEYRDKSISTIRRYIKSGNVTSRFVNGKYEILVRNYKETSLTKEDEINQLKKKLRKLQEENQELKMLVDLYEQKINFNNKNSEKIIRQ
jgi:DNA-binding transcriptional MerR regulator